MRKLMIAVAAIAITSLTLTAEGREIAATSRSFRLNQYPGSSYYPGSGGNSGNSGVPVYPGTGGQPGYPGNQGGTAYPGNNGNTGYPDAVSSQTSPVYPGTPAYPGSGGIGNGSGTSSGGTGSQPSLSDYQFYSFGHSKYAAGNFNAAVIYFDQLLRHYPSSQYADDAAFWRARISAEQKKHLEAISLFSNFVRIYPASTYIPEAIYLLAQVEKSFGRIQVANLQHLRDAAAWFISYQQRFPQSPQAAEALFQAGECYEIYGDSNTTKSYYYQVINLYPTSAAAVKAREKISGRY